jgi:hypothetical protein
MILAKRVLALLGIAALATVSWLYHQAWIATSHEVMSIIGSLLRTALWGWTEKQGFVRYYLLAGALTTLALLLRLGIPAAIAMIQQGYRDRIIIVVGIVVLGAIPIVAIPFVAVGWPVALWIVFWPDRKPASVVSPAKPESLERE